MKRLVGMTLALVVFSGCGNENQLDLAENSDNFAQAENKEMGSDILCEPFARSLEPIKSKDSSAKIEFSSTNEDVAPSKALGSEATSKQRCGEIQHYLSKAEMKMEISFSTSADEDKQMAMGKAVNMQPSNASLMYADGSLKGGLSGFDLRCEAAFSVTCEVAEMDGQKKCVSYSVNYPSQTCTFRASFLPFGFSDHKNAMLDILGKVDFMASGAGIIELNKISWTEAY